MKFRNFGDCLNLFILGSFVNQFPGSFLLFCTAEVTPYFMVLKLPVHVLT